MTKLQLNRRVVSKLLHGENQYMVKTNTWWK